MAQEYNSLASEEIKRSATKKSSKEINRTESINLSGLFKLDEFLLSPVVWTYSIAVPGTSRNNDPENREPNGDGSLGDPCPEAVFSTYHSINLNDTEQEETHHNCVCPMLFTEQRSWEVDWEAWKNLTENREVVFLSH